MKRATTPIHTFTLPSNASEYSDIHITYNQLGTKILELDLDDLTVSENVVSYRFSQEDANKFAPTTAQVQMRVRTSSGNVFASEIITFKVGEVLCDDILPLA